jgi:hypothetical protein
METCVVKKGNNFEAVQYFAGQRPLNLVLEAPENGAINTNNFFLVESGVTVSWNNYYGSPKWRIVEVRYKNTLLFEKNGVKNVQVVIDLLNKYKNISESELEVLLLESQEKEKTALEITIEELKAEKARLGEQIKIYKEIQTKKDEIKDLLSKLDS